MRPRACDNRVGYFSVDYEDYGANVDKVPTRCYITRWRLEPKDPNAAVSDPVKPIVFYLDPRPERWAPWSSRACRRGAGVPCGGFSNAITARRAHAAGSRVRRGRRSHSTIRWLPSTIENASDRTSAIPDGKIRSRTSAGSRTSPACCRPGTGRRSAPWTRERTDAVADSLMGEMVAYVATHEVGHTLGLPHTNSRRASIGGLAAQPHVHAAARHPYTIMDYARNNYVPSRATT